MFTAVIAVPTGAPIAIRSIVHDEGLTKTTEPKFDEISLGEALLEEHQFFELHFRLRVIRKVGVIDFAHLLRRGFYPALRRAGLRQVRFHDLRHYLPSRTMSGSTERLWNRS